MKKKIYVLMISRYFPATHPKEGKPTVFIEKILNSIKYAKYYNFFGSDTEFKIHTIRKNYELWAKRIKEVQEGRAVLSLRYWSGSPYNYKRDGSKQVEFCQLDSTSGIGIQKIRFPFPNLHYFMIDKVEHQDMSLSTHDGLSYKDFNNWFKNYDLNKPMAIIHFTGFRYSNPAEL